MISGWNAQSWFLLPSNRKQPVRTRVFCFPYAGGGASMYRTWNSHFPEGVEVVPVQLPGRESRGLEEPYSTIQPLVRMLAQVIRPLLNVPFSFFGHSMGALISYELARELTNGYGLAPEQLFVSAKSAPHLPHRDGKQLHHLPDREFKEELRKLNGTPEEILNNEELMKFLIPRLRADFALCETYQHLDRGSLTCPISVFGGDGDPGVSLESLQAWSELTSGPSTLHMVEGDHFFLHSQEAAITAAVQTDMNRTAEHKRTHALVLK